MGTYAVFPTEEKGLWVLGKEERVEFIWYGPPLKRSWRKKESEVPSSQRASIARSEEEVSELADAREPHKTSGRYQRTAVGVDQSCWIFVIKIMFILGASQTSIVEYRK